MTGYARLIRDAGDVARYERLLRPWVSGEMDQVIRIHPELVTGYELVDGAAESPSRVSGAGGARRSRTR